MGKITYVMITMLALTLALQIFSCSTWDDTGACTGNDASGLMAFLSDPSTANSSNIFGLFFGNTFGLLAVAGFTSLIIAGFYFNRNESYITRIAKVRVNPILNIAHRTPKSTPIAIIATKKFPNISSTNRYHKSNKAYSTAI